MDKREHNYIQGLSLATCGDFDAEAVINGLFVCIDAHLSVYTEVKSGYNAIADVFSEVWEYGENCRDRNPEL